MVLDRVFDREDIARTVIQADQTGIQRCGLARTGGAGDQQDAVGLTQGRLHRPAIPGTHAQALQIEASGLLVEQAQHHPLAIGRR
ncbi:hypothetical protein D9M68_933460 [compost metagenome]